MAKVEGDKVKVGLSDFSQKLAGEISNIEMPEEGDQVNQDKLVGSMKQENSQARYMLPFLVRKSVWDVAIV